MKAASRGPKYHELASRGSRLRDYVPRDEDLLTQNECYPHADPDGTGLAIPLTSGLLDSAAGDQERPNADLQPTSGAVTRQGLEDLHRSGSDNGTIGIGDPSQPYPVKKDQISVRIYEPYQTTHQASGACCEPT